MKEGIRNVRCRVDFPAIIEMVFWGKRKNKSGMLKKKIICAHVQHDILLPGEVQGDRF